MSALRLASKLLVVLVAAASAVACSSQPSPIAPGGTAAAADTTARTARGPGVYDLSFNVWRNGALVEVSSLPVKSEELILKARVTDPAGQPVQKGTVHFDYCSYKGGPRNDIERADEAPMEACADGTAAWTRLTSVSVAGGSCPTLGVGYACMNFGIVQIPRTVGFRIRYDSQGSGIASGTSAPENFTWVEAS